MILYKSGIRSIGLSYKNVEHIIKLAEEKGVKIIEYKDSDYNCISIINEK